MLLPHGLKCTNICTIDVRHHGLRRTKCARWKAGQGRGLDMARPRKPVTPFHYFNSSPEVIRLVVLMSVRFPSLLNVEDRSDDENGIC